MAFSLQNRDESVHSCVCGMEDGGGESLQGALNGILRQGLTPAFGVWEWRMFYPKRAADEVHYGRNLLDGIVRKAMKIAWMAGYGEDDLEVKRTHSERRTDVYVDIGEESVGLKYRGQEPGETVDEEVLVELKVRGWHTAHFEQSCLATPAVT